MNPLQKLAPRGASILLAIAVGCLWTWSAPATASAKRVITINSCYSPPLSSPSQDGYLDLVLQEAFGRLGLSVRVAQLPAARALKDAAAGHADGDVGRVAKIAMLYPTLKRVPTPILEQREFVAFARDPTIRLARWEDLAPYSVAYVGGWKIFEAGARHAHTVTPVESTEALFRFLSMGRTDIALSAKLDGLAVLKRLGLCDVQVVCKPLAVETMYLYLHESRKDLVAPLDRTLQAMRREGVLDAIEAQSLRRYVDMQDTPCD